jgi:hypothetical protein
LFINITPSGGVVDTNYGVATAADDKELSGVISTRHLASMRVTVALIAAANDGFAHPLLILPFLLLLP